MFFKDGSDLNDFMFYMNILKKNDTDDELESSYASYDVLRETYTHSSKLEKHYNDHELGFRDYLQRNAIFT